MLRRKGGLYRNGGIPARQCNRLSKLGLRDQDESLICQQHPETGSLLTTHTAMMH